MITTDQKDNQQRGKYLKPSGVSVDEVVKVTRSLLKGVNPMHVKYITQALLRHYFNWLPYRKIAEHTGSKDGPGVCENIAKVESDKYLNSLFTDLKDIFDTK